MPSFCCWPVECGGLNDCRTTRTTIDNGDILEKMHVLAYATGQSGYCGGLNLAVRSGGVALENPSMPLDSEMDRDFLFVHESGQTFLLISGMQNSGARKVQRRN